MSKKDVLAVVGKSVFRKESLDKVTGAAKYTADDRREGDLHAQMLTSPHAHAKILAIHLYEAKSVPGVRAILIGKDCPLLTGEEIKEWLQSNLCRCTGYQEIKEAVTAMMKANR